MDKVTVKVLADGTIKSATDEVSPENHANAEAFFKLLARLTGGESTRQMRGDAPTHHHHHGAEQTHSHGGDAHSH